MSRRLFWIAVVVGLTLLTPEARAQSSPRWRNCTGNPDVDLDQEIRSCSALIRSSREKRHYRAVAHNDRGIAYATKGDLDRGIADFNEAIRLDPKDAVVYRDRGKAYDAKGDHDRAIVDLDQAIRIDPKFAAAYNTRCWVRAVIGRDLAQALADCNEFTAASARRRQCDQQPRVGAVQARRIRPCHCGLRCGDCKECEKRRLILRPRRRQAQKRRYSRWRRRHRGRQGDQGRHRDGLRGLRGEVKRSRTCKSGWPPAARNAEH